MSQKSAKDSLARAELLRLYKILRSAPESEYDAIVKAALEISGAKFAALSFIDGDRQWFKAEAGIAVGEILLANSPCSVTLEREEAVISADALKDTRLAGIPAVRELRIRMFASFPLVAKSGVVVGTLCCGDMESGEISPQKLTRLKDLASQVLALLELRVERHATESEIKYLEAALARERQKLHEQESRLVRVARLTELGEMAAGIAHEINNPLAVISTIASLVDGQGARGAMDCAAVRKYMSKIEDSVQRLLRVAKNVRLLARDGSADPVECVNINEIVEAAVEVAKIRCHKAFIDLNISFLDVPVYVDARAVQLEQAVASLLNNAADAVAECEKKWIKCSISLVHDHVQIAVEDGGPGVPVAIQGRILEPFFTTKPINKGTGLGLSLAQSFVRAHGGTLELARSHHPTTFIIRLPISTSNLVLPGMHG